MNLSDLKHMARLYARDDKGVMWDDATVKLFINQGIDRIKQFQLFDGEPYLEEETDKPKFLPEHYHYLLAIFAASRLYDIDERFYEGTQKRNEFEQTFGELLDNINNGTITIDGVADDAVPAYVEYVTDTYFGGSSSTEGEV